MAASSSEAITSSLKRPRAVSNASLSVVSAFSITFSANTAVLNEDIIKHIRQNTQDADECMDILMLAKYLEKIGDHAENIGNWTIFMETGNMKDVRLL